MACMNTLHLFSQYNNELDWLFIQCLVNGSDLLLSQTTRDHVTLVSLDWINRGHQSSLNSNVLTLEGDESVYFLVEVT